MSRNWTKQQLQAIETRGGDLLVSAAAGSGKTAVLVERVIRRITDPVSPTRADRLLIVTFTRAAAQEVRQRIFEALDAKLRSDPGNEALMRQKALLPFAKICTIDAFCNSLVREHFSMLSLSPDFKNADDGELQLLSEQAMQQTLEALYAEGNADFLNLVELLFRGRDDGYLAEMILTLHRHAVSYPFPAQWLDTLAAAYADDAPTAHTVFGAVLMHEAAAAADYAGRLLLTMQKAAVDDDVLQGVFAAALAEDEAQLATLQAALDDEDWDAAKASAEGYAPARLGRRPKGNEDDTMFNALKSMREEFKDVVRKKIAPLFCCSEAQDKDDRAYLAPMAAQLVGAVKRYAAAFSALKKEKNLADFNDVAHAALSLLVTPDETGRPQRTTLAGTLAQRFDEILIDEYQDTNKTQDMLFSSIARDNLFRVGDVKQSIYRFRQAMPEIFIDLKDRAALYDPAQPRFPAKILLKNNFRSRASVTGAVNYVFSQVMSRQAGEVDYSEEEQLIPAAQYPAHADDCCELHLLDLEELDREVDSSDEFQANYAASLIASMLERGVTVKDGETERPATPKDFCILLRSINGGRGLVYANALKKQNIACFTEVASDFFAAHEVSLLLNLLRVIDNPKQDIPLLSVLLSVLFGFSVDDLADLRTADRDSDLYGCLTAGAAAGNEKAARFLDRIAAWRTLGVCMSVSDFLSMIYDETGVVSVISAMRDAAVRRQNLMLLLDYAETYEAAGYVGLSGFIRFIDRLERADKDLAGAASVSPDADVVRVMSIHKSKGLEFPFCIVANCAGRFNQSDRVKNVVVSPQLGMGILRRDVATLAQLETVPHRAAAVAAKRETVSEEMRVLYVAMTRAKEKLILISACKNVGKTLDKYRARLNQDAQKMLPFAAAAATSYADWLLPSLLRHPQAESLRDAAGYDNSIVLPAAFALRVVVRRWTAGETETASSAAAAAPDPAFLRTLETQLSWRYPFEPLTKLVSKRAASEVDRDFIDRDYFASSRPAFLNEYALTAAQRGTATHAFMQYADYARAGADVEMEIDRLASKGILTADEAAGINRRAVRRFFESDLARRMMQSPLLLREKKFTIEVPVTDLYDGLDAFPEEKVMIQGIADCAFLENGKLVVVDYKTDRLETDAQFREKYASQVGVYRRALAECTGYEVGETLLYSFHLNRAITVDNSEKL